jgi:transposase InsO family protein
MGAAVGDGMMASARVVREAQILIEQWRIHYNTVRPHSSLGYRPPAPESIVPMDQRPTMH